MLQKHQKIKLDQNKIKTRKFQITTGMTEQTIVYKRTEKKKERGNAKRKLPKVKD